MTSSGQQDRGSREVVLVVDDEPIVLRVFRGVLESGGYRVLAASCADEALDLFRREPQIDLLLTDVVMPEVSGPELADTLRLFDPGLRILFTAGMPDSPLIRSAVFDRGFAFLPKPFLPSELLAAVRLVLDHPRRLLAAHAGA